MTEPKTILDPAQAKMDKAIEFLVEALASVRAGKASTNLLNGITVDYYGNPRPYHRWPASPSPMHVRC